MKKSIIIILIYLFTLSNCGYKISNLQKNYNIIEIETSGNNNINYKIKNKLLSNNQSESINLIKLNIDTKKNKSIKEKNISNEITKYEIILTSKINYKSVENNANGNFVVTKTGNYAVMKKYSDTLNNEKNLIKTLTNEISEEIEEILKADLNDT